jgi:hypothetical protein
MENVGLFYDLLVHFTAIRNILWTIGMFCASFGIFYSFWYIVQRKIWQPWLQVKMRPRALHHLCLFTLYMPLISPHPVSLSKLKLQKLSVFFFIKCVTWTSNIFWRKKGEEGEGRSWLQMFFSEIGFLFEPVVRPVGWRQCDQIGRKFGNI